MSDDSEEYFTAEEEPEEEADECPDGFVHSTSPNGTVWFVPKKAGKPANVVVGFHVTRLLRTQNTILARYAKTKENLRRDNRSSEKMD